MIANADGDDSTIDPNEIIWRRIPENQVIFDNNLNRKRPSSACFNQDGRDGPISVYIASEAISASLVMQGGKERYLVSLTIDFVRKLGLDVVRDPSSGGPGHALILGRKTNGIQSNLAKTAVWVPPYQPQ